MPDTLADSKQRKIVKLKQNATLKKPTRGFCWAFFFQKKIKPESYQCSLSEQSETEKESKEAKKWTGKFIFGLTDESCAL